MVGEAISIQSNSSTPMFFFLKVYKLLEAIFIQSNSCNPPPKINNECSLKKNNLISNVTSSSIEPISLKIPEERMTEERMTEERMTDEEFKKVMQALEEIWSVCPENLPEDLSTRHDYYLK